MSDFQSYVLCTSPRSGSTLLCKMLTETGVAGHPKSYFHKPELGEWASYLGVSRSAGMGELEYLRLLIDTAIEQGTANTGIFGLRLQRHSFDFFFRQLRTLCQDEPTDKARFEAVFGRTLFVHLTRPDKLSQAVSYVKAQQSGLWHRAADGSELERLSPPADPVFDFEALKGCRDQFVHVRSGLERLVCRAGYRAAPLVLRRSVCRPASRAQKGSDRPWPSNNPLRILSSLALPNSQTASTPTGSRGFRTRPPQAPERCQPKSFDSETQ
jgi:LPS sulfotransferase NodH